MYRHWVFTMTPSNQSPCRAYLKILETTQEYRPYLRTVHHVAVGYDIGLHCVLVHACVCVHVSVCCACDAYTEEDLCVCINACLSAL